MHLEMCIILLDKEGNPKFIPNPEKDIGVVTKGIKSSWNGLGNVKDSLLDKIKPTSLASENETTNPSQDDKGDKNTKTVNDSGTKHNDSFIKDNPIVPNNREKFNAKSEIISAINSIIKI